MTFWPRRISCHVRRTCQILPRIPRGQQPRILQQDACPPKVICCCCRQIASILLTHLGTLVAGGFTGTGATIIASWWYHVVVEHRVRSIGHVGGVEMPEKDVLPEPPPTAAAGLPPGFRWRPSVLLARVECGDRREISISKDPRNKREIVRDGPEKQVQSTQRWFW